jgi:Pentapeptide repeats (8 copies)
VIEIKHRWNGKVLYTAENAQDVRQAVLEATTAKADLSGADLRSAYLSGADLRSAYLSGADLRSADLSGADLRSADLSGADLRSAYLRSADLRSADLRSADLSGADLSGADLRSADDSPSHPLYPIRLDVFAILDAAPAEVPALREKMVAGQINGSAYSGECACLCGTIANARGVDVADLTGIQIDSSRPAERWFAPIDEGDEPVDDLKADGVSEGSYRLTVALRWVDEWIESRTFITKSLMAEAAGR